MSKLSNFLTETGKATFKLGGAQTMKICVPVGSTYPYGDSNNKIELEEIPLSVGLNQQFSFPSPFGNTPGFVEVLIKVDNDWVKYNPQYISSNNQSRGITAVCNGDGYVHVTTGITYLAHNNQSSTGIVSPVVSKTTSSVTSTEVVFLVYAASSKTPDDYQAEETVIGTWFGKTLYRYCVDNLKISSSATVTLPSPITKLISIRGGCFRDSDDSFAPLPITYNNTYLTAAIFDRITLKLAARDAMVNTTCFVIVEYTKD